MRWVSKATATCPWFSHALVVAVDTYIKSVGRGWITVFLRPLPFKLREAAIEYDSLKAKPLFPHVLMQENIGKVLLFLSMDAK